MLTKKILNWYKKNKRNLPWRLTNDPYKIWLSEIILQQTRVEQGMAYYPRFIERFKKVDDLANASENEVLKLWEGLGYYSRARNLHIAAKQIVNDYGGELPDSKEELLKLKGVGDYTASAIASIAFKQPDPVIDGNVLRFISRLNAFEKPVDKKAGRNLIEQFLIENIDNKEPGEFNQAIMEFGALYCKPSNPDCFNCIFNNSCAAFSKGLVEILPIKSSKTKQRKRFFYYFIVKDNSNQILLSKRTGNDIWKGLYEFPLIELEDSIDVPSLLNSKELYSIVNSEFVVNEVSEIFKHKLSYQILHVQFIDIQVVGFSLIQSFDIVAMEDIENFPLPRLITRFFEKHKL